MAIKAQIKKWIKDISGPIIQKYGYKFGSEKLIGSELAILKKTKYELIIHQITIFRDDKVQLTLYNYLNFPLAEKLVEIIKDEQIKHNTLFQLPETNPYYKQNIAKDFSYYVPIKSKEQLKEYMQPLLDNFEKNIQLVEQYKYIPNLLKKWEEVESDYEKTKKYDHISNYFPSPFHRHFVYFLAKMIDYPNFESIFNKSTAYFESKRDEFKESNPRLSGVFESRLTTFKKVKDYFDNLSPEDHQTLKQEFAPFLKEPEV